MSRRQKIAYSPARHSTSSEIFKSPFVKSLQKLLNFSDLHPNFKFYQVQFTGAWAASYFLSGWVSQVCQVAIAKSDNQK